MFMGIPTGIKIAPQKEQINQTGQGEAALNNLRLLGNEATPKFTWIDSGMNKEFAVLHFYIEKKNNESVVFSATR